MNPPEHGAEGILSHLKPMGRARGQANFRVDEDVMLASAYVVVTTNAAVGTDQNGSTFWEKIRANFVQRGGNAGRNACSLQNRFNKVLQTEVNKYIGIMMSTLREYHSGWVLDDYVMDAKRRFLLKFTKPFKHEMVYNILKKSLPKYDIPITAIDSRVKRALFFCDNDTNTGSIVSEENGAVDDVAVVPPTGGVPGIGMCTPRPSVGKKKAKTIAYNRRQQMLKSASSTKKPSTEVELANVEVIAMRNNSLDQLVAAANRKNDLVQQQLMFQLFLQKPDSVESKAFFAAMTKKYTGQFVSTVDDEAAIVESVESPINDDTEDDHYGNYYDDDDDVNQDESGSTSYDGLRRRISGGDFCSNTVRKNGIAECVLPVVQVVKRSGNSFSQSSDDNPATPPPLPLTQNLLAALQSINENNVQEAEDTQATTLTM